VLRRARKAETPKRSEAAPAQPAQPTKDVAPPVLSVAALKVRASADHFVKVRQLIRDLVDKLRADALAEADENRPEPLLALLRAADAHANERYKKDRDAEAVRETFKVFDFDGTGMVMRADIYKELALCNPPL